MPHSSPFFILENVTLKISLVTFEMWFITTVLLSGPLSKAELWSQGKHMKWLGSQCAQAVSLDAS